MATQQKDTIYIDVDDEITAIIDKLRGADQKIVALVLPKRATVLQSVVNMKLLKHSAEKSKKHIVLITSEAGLLPLAGAVGLHVASTLQSKPAIPRPPELDTSTVNLSEDGEDEDDFDAAAAATQPVGTLAGVTEPETIELDDEPETVAAGAAATTAAKVAAPKKDKKLRVPNFNKFRLLLVFGGLALIGLAVFFYLAAFVLPKATVTIATDSSDISTNANVILDPAAKELDIDKKTLPAKIEQKQQTGAQQVAATGQKNKGTKATGEVKIINCSSGDPLTVPAGTGVSSNGLTFITQEAATMPVGSKTCFDSPGTTSDTVEVVSINPGTQYNIDATTFSVANYSAVTKASSSAAMTGGTDSIVKVVTQADIDSAKQKIVAQDSAAIKTELSGKLQTAGYVAVTDSLMTGEPVVSPSAAVGDEVEAVKVSQVTTYTMYGIKKADVTAFVVANVTKSIDPKKQKILNDGVDKAEFSINAPTASGPLSAALSTKSLAGPDIDTNAIKTAIVGQKTNDVRTLIKSTPGVTDVTVKYSPFWVSSVPKKTTKITIVVDKADASSNEQNP